MDAVMGPPGEGLWWRELGFMLASSMAMYRINKSKTKSDEEERRATIEELKASPEFRVAIAKEIVDEMRKKQAEDLKTQQEQQKNQRLVDQLQQSMAPPQAQAPPPQGLQPRASRMKPPPPMSLARAGPREDIPALASQTQAMAAEFGLALKPAAAPPAITSTTATATTRKHKDGGIIIESGV